ncbi:MAG: penicillin-binding protein activator LpoB [Pseudomonadales bacterium]|jgi:uncharacterized protein (TIGR02722 family)|nr:penicillin-binding protein activator LpoB [Pseudomonadales bacterium]
MKATANQIYMHRYRAGNKNMSSSLHNAVASSIIAVILLLSGCGSVQVSRVDSEQEIALTDRWNATDSELVSTEMISDMLSFPWVQRFTLESGKTIPTIIIQRIRNKSHEHIAVEAFTNDLKRALIRSGSVDFVAGGAEREDLRDERRDQELNASSSTAKQMGQETGADFVLSGTINSFVDQLDDKRVTSYQVDLKLINMFTNREVWNGQKKIKKFQEKTIFGF